MTIELRIDLNVDAAYLSLSNGAVVRTREVTDEVLVDLDELGVVVGVEVLSLTAEIPFPTLIDKFHVHTDAIDALRAIRPDVASFMSLRSAPDATTNTRLSVPVQS